ncbi:hypothetical protein RRG08_031794 [Elysia crispata]|uniref:Uncharacterized protein n=1 Tax=Elysia crispata TaxID=231223 RepID=A0AAE1CTL6_9GAST|nr:hypothetical protein RRG08_031794 [Elysia crispata]
MKVLNTEGQSFDDARSSETNGLEWSTLTNPLTHISANRRLPNQICILWAHASEQRQAGSPASGAALGQWLEFLRLRHLDLRVYVSEFDGTFLIRPMWIDQQPWDPTSPFRH